MGFGKLSLLFAIPSGYALLVFPPTGLALVAMLIWGYPVAIGIWIGGLFLNHEISGLSVPQETWGVFSLTTATLTSIFCFQTGLGVFLIRRYVKAPTSLSRTRDVLRFLFLGGPLSVAVGILLRGLSLKFGEGISGEELAFVCWNQWIGHSIGVFVFAPLLLILFGTPRDLWLKRKTSLGLPLSLGFISLVMIIQQSTAWQKKSMSLEFELAASERASQIQKRFESYVHCLYALANTMLISKSEDGQDFLKAAPTWMALYPGIYDFSWSPRVFKGQRAEFENRMRAHGFPDFEIRELKDGKVARAGERSEYFPSQYVVPYRREDNILGFDGNMNPDRRLAMEQARDSGRATTSGPLKLLQKVSTRIGTLVFYPIYEGEHDSVEDRRKNIRGFIKVTFSMADVVNVVRKGHPGSTVKLAIYDNAIPNTPIYSEISPPGSADRADAENLFQASWETTLDLADRSFLLKAVPTGPYWNGRIEGEIWFLFGFGMVFMGLLSTFLLTSSGASYTNRRELSERTRISEQLKQTATELSRSNSDLEQFAYLASHDLQEPLRTISSHLQLVEKHISDKLDKETKDSLDFAVDGAKRMGMLIKDLLEYSRVSRTETKTELVDVTSVVNKALNDLQMRIRERAAIITVGEMPSLRLIPTDGILLFQNLIGNALKYCPKDRKPEIEVKAEIQGEFHLFSVKDNGIGIPKADGERIFQLFQRLHGNSEYSGTGIGLAICKKVVERHGGKIWVESEVGRGSTFFFTLPRVG